MSKNEENSTVNLLKKENRDLNLRIYYMEEVIVQYPAITVDAKTLLKQNIDLKVKSDLLQRDLTEMVESVELNKCRDFKELERLKKENLSMSKRIKSINLSLSIALQNDRDKYDELKKKDAAMQEEIEYSVERAMIDATEEIEEQKELNKKLNEQLEVQEKISKDLQKELKDEKKKHSKELKIALNNLMRIEHAVGEHKIALCNRDEKIARLECKIAELDNKIAKLTGAKPKVKSEKRSSSKR